VTLDPLHQRVRDADRRHLLVSDTVGFIDRLPHALVAAFRATLEEVAEADLVVHVIDSASPERDRHITAVHRVLTEVGAEQVPRLDVYNKAGFGRAGGTATAAGRVPLVGRHVRSHGAGARRPAEVSRRGSRWTCSG
jgi:50S ribosomal subunit-associated GTPase HflX